jgi:archaellum component FlaC
MTLKEFNLILPDIAFIMGVFAAAWGAWRRMEKHQNDSNVRAIRIEDRLERIEKQFGPNGGGIRQAINEIANKLNKIEERQIGIGEKVAKLEGEFEQHTKEG